ncbi:MAG: hypothetical protein ABH844_02935 [Candidatus Omnitrophota bacterium]
MIQNALYWITEYHIDALRLDAIHEIYDFSAKHILREINDVVESVAQKLGRRVSIIAESDLNDSRIIRDKKQGGCGLAGQWSDDFHHAIHSYLTGEHQGYYEDFGRLGDITKAIKDGFVYDGKYSAFRKRHHGNFVKKLAPEKLVVCIQNHDQVGNRAFGERLSELVDFDKQKIAAVLLILSLHTPLLFMGQEYAEKSPFQYFINHKDAGLIQAVRDGRKEEFAAFGFKDIPDPESKKTFLNSKLSWDFKSKQEQRCLLRLYKDLIALRKSMLSRKRLLGVWHSESEKWLAVEYACGKFHFGIIVSFSDRGQYVCSPFEDGSFREVLNTAYRAYGGKAKNRADTHRGEIYVPPCSAVAGRIG